MNGKSIGIARIKKHPHFVSNFNALFSKSGFDSFIFPALKTAVLPYIRPQSVAISEDNPCYHSSILNACNCIFISMLKKECR